MTSKTLPFSIFITVTGTDCPPLINSRVIPNFVIQGGCPNGTGTGGPGYHIPCEINAHKHLGGSLSMAHAGKDTGGSQFFICHSPQVHLDGVHTVFGITSDMDVVNSIEPGDKIISVSVDESAE